jgi:predicted DNA-binding transcriptional regulator YafY
MDELIRTRRTGSPSKFARLLAISESTLFENIKILKNLGCPIKYDFQRKTYYYDELGCINFYFQRQTPV